MSAPVIYAVLAAGLALSGVAFGPDLRRSIEQRRRRAGALRRRPAPEQRWDPGRALRAERRARQLLLSVVGAEDYAMYCELGYVGIDAPCAEGERNYGYLIYPHRPIVSYDRSSGLPLSEHCIQFPDHSAPIHGTRLPDADDVLAKWMTLRADERGIIGEANMHAMGRQIDPAQATRDIERLREWRRRRAAEPQNHEPTEISA